MKRIWKYIVLILVVGIIIADLMIDNRSQESGTSASSEDQAALDLPLGTTVGDRAPDFTGTTLDGENFTLSDHRGEIVVLNVFASWCAPCRLETPHLVAASTQLSDEGVVFVGINLQEQRAAVSGFQAEFGIDYPLVLNENGDLTKSLYQPIGLPTSWFLDGDGVVRFVFAGALTQESLLQIIDDIKFGREPNPFGASG